MKKWVRANFSKKIRENHTIQKQISCPFEAFDYDDFMNDVKYYDVSEINIYPTAVK